MDWSHIHLFAFISCLFSLHYKWLIHSHRQVQCLSLYHDLHFGCPLFWLAGASQTTPKCDGSKQHIYFAHTAVFASGLGGDSSSLPHSVSAGVIWRAQSHMSRP